MGRGRKMTYGLLALAVLLLIGSAVGSTQAALTIYSEEYRARIETPQIGVTLIENGDKRWDWNYSGNDWEGTNQGSGELLQDMLGTTDGKLAVGKEYDEKLEVLNSGGIDEYVRVRIYKYWSKEGEDGKERKDTSLSPDLIDLHLVNLGSGLGQWAEGKSTPECTELYYKGILRKGSEPVVFADKIRIDKKIASAVEIQMDGNKITTIYKYDGATFHVDVEVDAVQTHNAADAIMSSWGVDAAALGILEEEE